AREDTQHWDKRYQGTLAGNLDLQDQIARDVAANLKLDLTSEEDERLTRHHTKKAEAYLAYSEGACRGNDFTEAGLETAIDSYRRALAKDPNYAPAYAGLGRCYRLLGAIHRGLRQTHAEATQNYQKALAIDNSLAE